ncbi:MAG: Ig-like domain-containing protein [Paludibacteraceae bacterium]|nr:Ig-like domain-containing protein [Paludibacteraceae bacterium]
MMCFSQVGSSTTYITEEWTIPSSDQWTYVGWQGSWHNDNAKSANLQLSSMRYGKDHSNTLGSISTNVMEGAKGYVQIYSDNNESNKYVGFVPSGYILRRGTDSDGWTSTAFIPDDADDVMEDEWTTPLTSFTADNADHFTYVGLKTASGYVWTNRSETRRPIFLKPNATWKNDNAKFVMYYWDDSSHSGYSAIMTDPDGDGVYEAWIPNTYSYNHVLFGRLNPVQVDPVVNWDNKWNQTTNQDLPSDKNLFEITGGSDQAFTGSWSVYGSKGKFHIWSSSNTNNWYCQYYPHYVLTYDAKGGSGEPSAQSVPVGGTSSERTVEVAAGSGMTAPTGYTFAGWNPDEDDADAGTIDGDYDPSDNVTLSADMTLYAVWSPIPVTSITVSPSSKTLDVGGTQQLSVEVLPATALDKTVTWSTSNGSIATVSSTGLVTAEAPGSCTITATAHDGSGVTGTCSITVNKIQPTKYDFSVNKTVLCGEETATLTLAGSEDGVTYELREDSSTPIAETQKTGTGYALTWTGLGAGTYVVYAVADATYTERQMNSSKITVTTGTATSITTQPTNREVTVGEEATLTVVAAGTSLSYQWKESATEGGTYSNVASGGTSASYSVTPAAAGTKWYKCVVTGTCGEVTTEARKIVANAAVDPLVSWTMNVNNATWGAASTSNHGNTEISSIATSCDAGGEKASTSATAKVLMAEAEVTTSDPPSNSANFTFTLATGYKIVPEKITCKVFNVSSGSRTYKAQISDNNSHVYNSTNTLAVSTEATLTPATFNFASDLELKGNITLKIYAWDTDDSKNPTEFRMGPDIKFYGEIETACTSVAAPTGLTCSTAGVNSLAFSWTAASNASSYDVYLYSDEECTSPVTPTEGSPYNVSTNSATLTGLTASTTYYCKVQSKGDGEDYCTDGGTTDAEDAATTCTSITPTWSYPFSTIGVGITIFPTIGGNTGSGTVTYTSSATSYVEISNDMPKGKAAGSATVTASVAATGNYCSGSVTSGTITVVADQSGLIKQTLPAGKGTSWGTPSAPATSGTYASDITSTSVLTNTTGITIDTDSKGGNDSNGGQTAKITSLSSYDADKYMSLGFTVASGKKLNVSAIYIPVQPVNSNTNTFKAVLTDDDDDTEDIEGIITNVTNGKLTYIKFSSYGSVTGNVTLKIYAYGWTDGYRFGKSIVIDGETESTATLYDISTSATNGTIAVTVGGASASSAEEDATVTITATPSSGYSFSSWSVAEDDSGDPVSVTSSTTNPTTFTMPAADVTVSATFTPNTYGITYHLNGASWAGAYDAPATYTVGTGATLPVAGNMTNTGYSFNGWKNNSGLTGDNITAIGTSDYGNKEFWAKWTENTYTITYNANGDGAGNVGDATGSTSDTEGHYVTVADNGFALEDHVFAGWNTAANGSGESYSEGEEIELTANMTLYAIWTDDYNVTWGDVQIGGAGDAVTPNLGGKNYTITATIATWTGDVTDIELGDVTSGVTASITGTTSSPSKTVTITFAVGTSVVGDEIELSINIPAHGDYGAKTSTEEIDIERCGGSAGATTIFSNDFSTATAVAYVNDGSSTYSHSYNTSSTLSNLVGSGTNLFTSLASSIKKGNIAVNSSTGGNSVDATGFFQVYGNGDNPVYWSLNRTSDFAATAPTALQVSMDIWYKNLSSGSSIGVQFAVGDGFSDGLASGTSQASSKVHSGFGIYSNSTAKLYAYENIKTELYSTGITQETWLSFVWIINNTGSDLTYNNPTGSGTTTLANDKFDLWLKTQAGAASTYTKIINAAAATTASKDLQNLYIGNNPSSGVKKHEFRLDNVVVKDISPSDSKVTTTLSWSPAVSSDEDWDSGNNRLNKKTSDADFTFTATQDKNSLGAITYASSNTSVVTVNATTGKVHVEGAGDATITATLAESGCYNKATATYAIHVVDDCDDEAGTISTEDLGCDGIRMTVTGHTAAEGVSYQWYKVKAEGSDDEVGEDQDNYTATTAGEYYVIVTNTGDGHCAMASTNTVTLEASESATASKIVNQWYVKNGRRTPDVALVQTTNATGFYVKIGDDKIWDEANDVTTGFGGCPFRLGDDGIIYLNGQTSAGAAPSGLTTGDVTLKITATACGGNSSELSIVIHKQAATTAKSVAFVVDGTKGGEITAFTAAHATTSPLYVYLDSVGTAASARQFSLTGRNAYWSTVDSTLKAHYSQFDVILITDDPSTQTVPDGVSGKDAYKTQGYINALGALIDVRPILTMEAFVSALANWKSKGINGNPTSPNPRQYAMKLDCKDHEIFNGLEEGANVVATVEDGTTYWTVTMVDKTKSPYSALATDATDYDGTPALQGFSASDVSSLLLLGEISDGAHYAGVERQEEPAARLMLLGLNAKALPNALTEEGKIIIENALTYLLKTNMEEVDDCSNYFTGATSTDWNTPTNWSKGVVPNSPMVRARILKPCEISGVTAKAAQIDIVTGGTSSKFKGGSGTCTGKLTINPTGALVVGGEIRTAEAPYYNKADLMPTDTNNLVINTNATNQAALVFNNDKGDTKATVNLYSLGRTESSAYQFQYFAVPMTYIDVNPAFAGAGIYTYVWTEASGWERRGYYEGLEAFEGVGITTTFTEAKTYQMKGTLASTEEREITLTTGGAGAGQNIVGNSWLAPIDIASLKTGLVSDANIVDKTIYIYCTGKDGASVTYGTSETPGQWLAIPIEAAAWSAWEGLKVIPAMQGFCIIANSETTLTLNYNDHVRSTASDKLTPYLRAPKREASHEGIDLIRIRVADSQTHTDLYLFEGESFSEEFDNGWEAKYMSSDGRSAKLYAETAIGPMAVVAQPEYEGTVLGFAPGKETEYTFTFSGPNKEYYLNDLKEKKSTLISEEESYMFTFEEGDTNRFYISKTPINAPSVATGTENTGDGVKARKVLVNDKLYIILNGRVYSAEGVMVK